MNQTVAPIVVTSHGAEMRAMVRKGLLDAVASGAIQEPRALVEALRVVGMEPGFLIEVARLVETRDSPAAALSVLEAAMRGGAADAQLADEARRLVDASVAPFAVTAAQVVSAAPVQPSPADRSGLDRFDGLDQLDGKALARLVDQAAAYGRLNRLKEAAIAARAPDALRATLDRLISDGAASVEEIAARVQPDPDWGFDAPPPEYAIAILDAGLSMHPQDGLLALIRASRHATRGDGASARRDAETAYALAPASRDVVGFLADRRWLDGDRAGARQVLAGYLTDAPDDVDIAVKAATFAFWDYDGAQAEATLRDLLAKSPDRDDAIALLATVLCARRAFGEAETLIRRRLEVSTSQILRQAEIRVAHDKTRAAFPHYVDAEQVERLIRAVDEFGLADLDVDLRWRLIALFCDLDRAAVVRSLVEEALALSLEASVAAAGFREFLDRVLRDAGSASREKSPALAAALLEAGLAHLATGGSLDAWLAFRLGRAIDPANEALAFNAGFADLAYSDPDHARRHFRRLERIYDGPMGRVAWPRFGHSPWPHRAMNLAPAFLARRPDKAVWPKITVITPSFNQGAYIEETILSTLHQEYPNLEYIMVDGLSTDGARDVIERYRDRFAHVIIEKDRGQTDAINKGLRLATGDLVTWLNSDDMFAPGALFSLAEAYLETKADILFGQCLPHKDYRFQLANLPKARQETFTPAHIADIFKYWMKGFFFYQPEVIFTRRILEKVGPLLDESLFYTMDYDFWMKCAKASARIEAVAWPIALFRHHENQKTAKLLECMLELADVRDRAVQVAPSLVRASDVREQLAGVFSKARPHIGVVSARLNTFVSADTRADLRLAFADSGLDVTFEPSASRLGEVDLLIKLVHLTGDVEEIDAFRKMNPSAPVVGWFWDNHHHLFANYDVAEALDVVIAGHDFAKGYLRNRQAIEAASLPLCVTQWSRREATRAWRAEKGAARVDALYGGFVRYAFAEKRNVLLEQLIAAGEPGVYFLDEAHSRAYFGKSSQQRFAEWARHKVSICLPLRRDLSLRLFDALLTGQVPIVAPDIADLDLVLPAGLRARLPVVTMRDYSLEAVRDAHREALALFDAGGAEAAEARHIFAIERHMLPSRARSILDVLRDMARGA